MSIETSRKLEVKQAEDIARHYGVPQSLVNLYFVELNGKLYPMEPFLIRVAQKKGYQRIEVKAEEVAPDEWEATCNIYPIVPKELFLHLDVLDADSRKKVLDYHMQPTSDVGRASKANVKMSTMHLWLREMAVKRATARACRKFSGVDLTAYEELPEAELTPVQLKASEVKS